MNISKIINWILSAIKSPYLYFVDVGKSIFIRLSDRVYKSVPTREGKLDERLESNVREGLLSTSISFKTFNSWVGKFVSLTVFLLLLGVSVVLIFFGILLMGDFLQDSFLGVLDPIVRGLLVIIGFLLLLSYFTMVIADFLLILYCSSIVRYGIKQAQRGLRISGETEKKLYEFQVTNSDTGNKESKLNIYRENLLAFSRAILYSLLAVLALSLRVFYNSILDILDILSKNIPTNTKITSSVSSWGTNVLNTVDYLIPFKIDKLLTHSNIQSLLAIVIFLFVFSTFLNIRKVYYNAKVSQYDFSDFQEFTFSEEKECYNKLISVLFYQLLQGDLRSEYETIRGDVLIAITNFYISLILSYVYIILIMNTL